MASAPMREERFAEGTRVRFFGLKGRADLNDQVATVRGFKDGRHECIVDGTNEGVRVKLHNLVMHAPTAPYKQAGIIDLEPPDAFTHAVNISTWDTARGTAAYGSVGLPQLAPAAKPTLGPNVTPHMLDMLKRCAACGRVSSPDQQYLACGCCRLMRYCSRACQQQAYQRGHEQSCGARFPSQARVSELSPVAAVNVLREFGPAHAYLAATALARINTFAKTRIEATVAGSQAGLTEMTEMIKAGAAEACLWAMHAHLNADAVLSPGDSAAPSGGDSHSQAMRVQMLAPYALLAMMQSIHDGQTVDESLRARVEDEFIANRGIVAFGQAIERHPRESGIKEIIELASDAFMNNFASDAAAERAEKDAYIHAAQSEHRGRAHKVFGPECSAGFGVQTFVHEYYRARAARENAEATLRECADAARHRGISAAQTRSAIETMVASGVMMIAASATSADNNEERYLLSL